MSTYEEFMIMLTAVLVIIEFLNMKNTSKVTDFYILSVYFRGIISILTFCGTHATLLLANGMDIDSIAQRLGHANSKVTREIYLHILEQLKIRNNNMLKTSEYYKFREQKRGRKRAKLLFSYDIIQIKKNQNHIYSMVFSSFHIIRYYFIS